MRHPFQRLLTAILSVGPATAALAESRFPPPQFETDHSMPGLATPTGDPNWHGFIDVFALIAALSVATYFVHFNRSRRGIVATSAFSLLYFGFWREGCVCSIGSIQNVTLGLFDPAYAVPLVVGAFFLIPLIFVIFFGRVFCAGACPLGAIQDLIAVKPIRVPAWIESSLGIFAHMYLGLAVLLAATGSAFVICEYDPFIGFFRMTASTWMLIYGAAFLLVGAFIIRPYCRYLCPYGVLLGWLSWAARWRPAIDIVGCVQCHLCKDSCPVNAIDVPREEAQTPGVAVNDRRRVGLLLLAAPLVVLLGGGLGTLLAEPMSRLNFDVQLAERIALEEKGVFTETTDASASYRGTGQPISELYELAEAKRGQFAIGAPLYGLFVGIVLGGRLVRQARRTQRTDYEISQTLCVACGRCFTHCPHYEGPDPYPVGVALTLEGLELDAETPPCANKDNTEGATPA
jgi:ferredoxin